MRGLVIAGTGTDIGKTVVTAGLLRALRGRGIDAVAQKPLQTGARRRADGSLDRPDLDLVARIAGWSPDPDEWSDLAPCTYEPACSPHLAARLAGEAPELARVVDSARRLAGRHACVLTETAGGLLVPIRPDAVNLDWIRALQWPVLLVAHSDLGTLNETLLSLAALRAADLRCVGVVLNDRAPDGADPLQRLIREDNAQTIPRHGGVPVVAHLPYLGADPCAIDWSRFEAAFRPSFDAWRQSF